MKKKTFLMSLPLLATLILSACGNQHTHSFNGEWKYDEINHWHECTTGDGEKDGLAAHTWDEGRVTTAATCTEDGVKTYTCECGATKTETITHSGHHAAIEWQTDGTYHWHNCTNADCYEELDKEAHAFVEDQSRREEADCTKKGKKVLVCSVCGEEKEEEIKMAEHSWDDGEITTPATCQHDGVKTFTCSVCEKTRTETISATAHSWESKGSGEAFQYNANGSWEECSECHTHRNEVVNTKAPWAAFDFENEDNVVCQHSDPTAYDKETHTLTTSNYKKDDGVKFTIEDIVDSTRKIVEVTVTVNGQTSWGPQGSFFFLDENGLDLGSVFCLGTNPFQDASKHETQYITTVLEGGKEVKTLSAIGAEFTYRFDFRQFEKAPRTFIINGANGEKATPDIISVKSIIAKESICGHVASDTKKGTDVASTCKVAGYTEYVCNHEGCGNVEYRIEKELADHTPKETTGAEKAYKYEFGGKYTTCSVCGEVLDDSTAVKAPWGKVEADKITLTESTYGNNKGHTPERTVEDGIVSIKGYYNACLWADASSVSQGRNILSITLKPSTWDWSGYCFYMHIIKNDGKDVAGLPSQYYSTTTPQWIEAGGKIYDESGEEVPATSVNANSFFTFEIDLTSKLNEGEFIKHVTFVTGFSGDDSGTSFSKVPTLSVKDVTFKQTRCGHASDCLEEKTIKSEATCADSVVEYCNECKKVTFVKSTTLKDGYTKQDLGTYNGIRGSSSVYDANTHVINNTCTNQFGPMFAIGENVDEIYVEMKILSAADISKATFFFYLSSAPKDISWTDRYAFDVKSDGSTTNINYPTSEDVHHSFTDSQGEAITSWDVGDTIVLKLDIAAIRTAGYGATMLLLGTKESTAIALKSMVYHTVAA